MELWRRAANPWNQEVLIGISWNLMWAAAIAGVLFVVGHTLWAWRGSHADVGENGMPSEPTGIPARILRHTFSARAFHWLMALSMFALLITAFFPVLGIQFAWVQIHWIAGVVLILTVVYHVIHATFWQDLWSMWIGREDVQVATTEVKRFLGQEQPEGPKAAKYPLDHKLYHHAIVVVTFAAIITGILMMFRVDTWFWARNPYILGDRMWGFVYVAHGLSGVALIALVISHIYFAIRPEKWWITMSMINGFVGRKDYIEHHDPARWMGDGTTPTSSVTGGAGTGALATSEPQEREPSG